MPDDDLIVKVTRILERGVVKIPLEIREKLDLQPGTRMMLFATEDGIVLRKIEPFLGRDVSDGLFRKIRMVFSKVPIRNIEE